MFVVNNALNIGYLSVGHTPLQLTLLVEHNYGLKPFRICFHLQRMPLFICCARVCICVCVFVCACVHVPARLAFPFDGKQLMKMKLYVAGSHHEF